MSHTASNSTSTDRLEKQVTLDASQSRVWRAITDSTQFGKWFGVALAAPFSPGNEVSGKLTIKNYDHLTLQLWVEKIEPETLFSFRWHPHAIEQGVDYSNEPTTLVTFTLETMGSDSTRLTIIESGFDAIPVERRVKAFTNNSNGWGSQLENVRKFLAQSAG